jgi:integrase/recombinase XerD
MQTAPTAPQPTALATALGFDTSILAGSVSESTQRIYMRDFAAYLYFAGSAEAAMLPSTLAQWRAHLVNNTASSPNTINRMISAVKRLIREAAVQGYATHETAAAFDQVAGVKVKALKERQKANARTAISPEQMRAICNAPSATSLAGKMHRALLATLAGSGCRISEVVSLTTAQMVHSTDDEGRSGWYLLVMGKNETEPGKRPLSDEAERQIREWLTARSAIGVDSDYVFTGFSGRGSRGPRCTPISPVSAWELVQRYSEAAGVPNVKPHDFRRFVGTRLAKKDIRLAQRALGHKRIETTAKHYVMDDLPLGMTNSLY